MISPGSTARWRTQHGVDVIRVPAEERWGLVRNYRRWRSGVHGVLASVHPDIIHGQGLPVPGAAGIGAGIGAPCVITAHGSARHDTAIGSTRLMRRTRNIVLQKRTRAAIRAADAVVSVHSDWQMNLPLPGSRFVHIPNIVDTAYYDGQRRPVRGRVLFCGGPRRIKGWDVLATAWPDVERAVPDAHLRVVGWPSFAARPERQGSMEVTGQLSAQQMVAAMENAEVVVIPSRYEVAPVVLAEAWALGVPVVASSVGGIPAMAQDAAILVPRENPSALAEAVIGVLNGTVSHQKLVDEGSRRAQMFRDSSVVAAHLRLYEELLSAR